MPVLQTKSSSETDYIFSNSLHFSNQLQILISDCKLYSAGLVERKLNLSPFGVSPGLQDCVILLGLVQYSDPGVRGCHVFPHLSTCIFLSSLSFKDGDSYALSPYLTRGSVFGEDCLCSYLPMCVLFQLPFLSEVLQALLGTEATSVP